MPSPVSSLDLSRTCVFQIEGFLALAETGSFASAARQLGSTPAALSRHLRKLEAASGVSLVDWRSRTPLQTRTAKAFEIAAGEILREWQREIASLERNVVLPDRIEAVVPESISACHSFGNLLASLQHRLHPCSVHLRESAAEPSPEILLEHRADLLISWGDSRQSELETQLVGRSPFYALVPSGHPLAKRSSVSVAELCRQDLVSLDAASHPNYASAVRNLFANLGRQPEFRQQVSKASLLVAMVSEARYCALVHALGWNNVHDKVRAIPLTEHADIEVRLFWRKGMRSGVRIALGRTRSITPLEYLWGDSDGPN